eukprot:GABV01008595.1.p1 GENE.GABV01008595.1~~GABV01008595.1.p1  ORF type:complete len:272 (-),score=72.16 GABV01008595.1:261-1076(-)
MAHSSRLLLPSSTGPKALDSNRLMTLDALHRPSQMIPVASTIHGSLSWVFDHFFILLLIVAIGWLLRKKWHGRIWKLVQGLCVLYILAAGALGIYGLYLKIANIQNSDEVWANLWLSVLQLIVIGLLLFSIAFDTGAKPRIYTGRNEIADSDIESEVSMQLDDRRASKSAGGGSSASGSRRGSSASQQAPQRRTVVDDDFDDEGPAGDAQGDPYLFSGQAAAPAGLFNAGGPPMGAPAAAAPSADALFMQNVTPAGGLVADLVQGRRRLKL